MARFKFEKAGEDSYDLALYQDDHRSATNHILIVMQSVDRRDIEAKTLLSKEVMPTFKATTAFARQHARRITNEFDPPTFTCVNFNMRKHLHLPPELRAQEEARFARRVHEVIQKVKPHKVLISGDQAMKAMQAQVKNSQLKRGWFHNLPYGSQTLPTVNTLDWARLLENDGAQGNLLGFWCHHLANLIIGSNPYDIGPEFKRNLRPRLVDTDAKFKMLLDKLRKTKSVAIDTETRGLSVYKNEIYMIQFCFEEEFGAQYIVPLNHPSTPLTPEQSKAWGQQLRMFFQGDRRFFRKKYSGTKKYHPHHRIHQLCENHELPELVFFNGAFDLRIIRSVLDVQIVPHYVWEVRAGEHLLDENANALKFFGTPSGGLNYVSHYYGSDFYSTAEFGKEERDTCGQVPPNDPGLLKYCSADVLHLQLIKRAQMLRASHQLIGDRAYAPYFARHMRHIMGETEHQLSRMRQCGSAIDVGYLKHLVSEQSPLKIEINEKEEELKAYDSIQTTNSTLLGNSGFRGVGLWRDAQPASAKWLFSPSKPAHRVALFIDQLKLEPVDFTDKGAPAIDKAFIEQYKMNVAEVETYAEHQEIDKLYGTYAKGWLKRLRTTIDGVTDYTLRPDYSYMGVTTGRLASYDPSLQVIPQRGRAAKLVKRAFVARKGYILLKFDFSAHEVRFWSIVSGDMVIADTFRKGQKLRQRWIMEPTDEVKKLIKSEGDVHLINVKLFFNKIVEKSDPLRDAVKRAVFGTIYGLGAASLGEQTKAADIVAIKDKIVALRKERREASRERMNEIAKEEAEQLRLMAKIRAEDREQYAQDIMDKLLKIFPKGAAWLERMKKQAVEKLHVYSPFGRIRHLYAALIQENQAQSKQVRRGVNAPIQGVSSEQGTEGNRAIDKTFYMEAPIIAKELGLDVEHASKIFVQRIVHDASYFMVPIDMVIPLLHIMMHEATYGSRDRVKKHFGLEYTIEPEIEAEFGMDDSNSYKFDFSMKSLVECIGESIKDGEKLGLLDCSPKEAMKRAFAPWINPKTRAYLHKRFPLLNVPEAVNVVPDALKMASQFSFAPKEEKK